MNFTVKNTAAAGTAVGLSVSTSGDLAAAAWAVLVTVESTGGKHLTGLMRAAYKFTLGKTCVHVLA